MSENDPGERWYPPRRAAGNAAWVGWLFAVFSLLTNGYFLRFLEPHVSRGTLVVLVLALAVALTAIARFGAPGTRAGWKSVGRRAVVPALLLAIAVLAFSLRVSGIDYGLPQSYVSDEYDYVASALTRLKRGDFNPRWWHYPSLQPYLASATYLAVFYAQLPSGRWSSIHQVVEEDMIYWGRMLSVVFGAATVALTFFLGRRLYGPRVGLAAAALLAVFPGVVEHSQYNKPDALLYLTVVISVLVTLRYFEKRGARDAALAGVAIGFVVASKYNGVLVAIPFVLAVALVHGRKALSRPDLYVGLAAAALTFLVLNPYFLPDFARAVDDIASEVYGYSVLGRAGVEGENNWWTHARYTAGFGAGLLAALSGLLGVALLLRRLDAETAIFLSFPIAHYAHYSAQKVNWPGNLIPVFPFLAVAAAYAVDAIAKRLASMGRLRHFPRLEALAASALVALLAVAPLARVLEHNRALAVPDAGNVAREWIDAAFPPGTHFAVERHAPIPNRSKYPITLEARIVGKTLDEYRELGVDYLVLSSMVYERFGPGHRITKAYDELFRTCPLVKEFGPVEGKLQGPTIRVLGLPRE